MLTRRLAIALAAASLACAVHAQTPAPAAAPVAPPPTVVDNNPRVVLTTALGTITLELYADKAPITVRNYLHYVDTKRFDGATFYRASKPKGYIPNDYGTVQGGLQNDPKKVFPPIAHESTAKTGILHKDGVISMGRHAPGTAQSDWFICVGEMKYLDADASQPGFAAFGKVLAGMDVVKTLLGMPTDPNKGEGPMKGEILVKPVKILSARRLAPGAPLPGAVAAPAPAAPATAPAASSAPAAPAAPTA